MRNARVQQAINRKPLALLLGGGLLLTGCTLAGGLNGLDNLGDRRIAKLFRTTELRKTSELPMPARLTKPTWRLRLSDSIVTASVEAELKTRETETITAKAPVVQNAFTKSRSYSKTTEQIKSRLSARCRRILAEAGIDTTILRSPTVSGEVGDSGNLGASISYDFIDLRRANLKEELAGAACQRDALLVKLNLLLFTSSQALTRAGYLAKANELGRSGGEMAAIERRIRSKLREGAITQPNATNLHQHLANIKRRQSFARGEAARREIVDRALFNNYKGLDRGIAEAERRIQEINRRQRTTDAFKVTASAGYTQTNRANIDPGTILSPNDFSAKIKVSLRLGALRTRRHDLEDIAADARVESLFEEDRGVLWRAGAIGDANSRALSSLRQRRSELQQAIATARSNATITGDGYEDELTAVNLRAQIDIVAFRAELAGVDATIADTRKLGRKLRFEG